MRCFLLILLSGLILGHLPGCIRFGEKVPEAPEATLPSWLGKVVMVDKVHQFAVVDIGSSHKLEVGTEALCFREQRRTATLQLTKESQPPYAAFEIIQGMPGLGDRVALNENHSPSASE